MKFTKNVLKLDPAKEAEGIVEGLKKAVRGTFRRQGAVLGISGGVDSAVVLHLCVEAFGPTRITALMLPEKDSSPDSERLAREVCAQCGVHPLLEPVTDALAGFGCYERRDEAIRRVIPDYDAARGDKAKIVLPQNPLERDGLNIFSVTVVDSDGRERTERLPIREFQQVVAASNFKQRARMAMLYYHAECQNHAVIGTANKDEHDQGFFVKHGDSGVDIQAIGHLYKTQVYQLADFLGVPKEIRERPPTSDTYSAPCTQEEFFFRIPFETMDLLAWALEHGVPASEAATVLGFNAEQVRRAYDELTRKFRNTAYLRSQPLGIEDIAPQSRHEASSLQELTHT